MFKPDKFPETRFNEACCSPSLFFYTAKQKCGEVNCRQISHQWWADSLLFVTTVEVTLTGFHAKTSKRKVC